MSSPVTPTPSGTPSAKRGKAATTSPSKGSTGAALNEDLTVLLLATNPKLVPNFKAMAVLNDEHTASSYEHKFRPLRAAAKALYEAKGGDQGIQVLIEDKKTEKKGDGENAGKGMASKGVAKRKNGIKDGEEGDANELVEAGKAKKAKVVKEAKPKRKTANDSDINVEDEQSVAKKAKVEKKGTARKMLKKSELASSSDESDGDGNAETAPVKNGKAEKKAVVTARKAPKKAEPKAKEPSKAKAKVQAKKPKIEDEADVEDEISQDSKQIGEKLVEMAFDENA
ncbi:hypothetical protein MMC12_005847 [Toensbergia leucococca]|nr:hypothetical protein [Toensbergia leucococca]